MHQMLLYFETLVRHKVLSEIITIVNEYNKNYSANEHVIVIKGSIEKSITLYAVNQDEKFLMEVHPHSARIIVSDNIENHYFGNGFFLDDKLENTVLVENIVSDFSNFFKENINQYENEKSQLKRNKGWHEKTNY